MPGRGCRPGTRPGPRACAPATAQWLREQRLAALIACACATRRCTGGARTAPRLADFEPVDKAELMQHFDDWATDRRITRAAAASFIADTDLHCRCLARRLPGVDQFGHQRRAGLVRAGRAQPRGLRRHRRAAPAQRRPRRCRPASGSWGLGQRFAFVGASGGHFAGLVTMTAAAAHRAARPCARASHLLSVQQPLARHRRVHCRRCSRRC